MHNIDFNAYMDSLGAIAIDAGTLILRYWQQNFEAMAKDENSPVTEADIVANHHICAALAELTPHIPIVAEENDSQPQTGATFWLVDPLDGTRSFVRGEDEFTVNIGLVQNGRPMLGVIYVPVLKTLYYGAEGLGAFIQQGDSKELIRARTAPEDGLTVVRSKSHMSKRTEEFLRSMKIREVLPGSSSVKFCLVAEGSADIYPRLGRTMEWDTAAGHAILNAAGGHVKTEDGGELVYGKPGFENPGFIAYGK
ncbi:MAG: 3'(2'),5'-bisphosphate nucleotidase CysQ [Alphaproteobacteria bacterium]